MSFNRSGYKKCLVEYDSSAGTLTLIPLNDQGDDELESLYDGENGNTTVAWAQSDAGRDGYGQTSGPYEKVVLTFS